MTNVGPAPQLEMEFKQRMNFLAGDNGLGKTFLLDAAWWAMTRTWARQPMVPHGPPARAKIDFCYSGPNGFVPYCSEFDRLTEQWTTMEFNVPDMQLPPSLVLYAQVDGGFSIWDPVRNFTHYGGSKRPPAYLFRAEDVWNGNELCEGLVRDWASWQRETNDEFRTLVTVLETLSPSEKEILRPGELKKLTIDDPKRYPTIRMPYGEEVAVIHASAGMRRIIALAYLLVWTWWEHLAATKLLGGKPVREIILLIDEVEAHLHPRWQRRIVPALLSVMNAMTGSDDTKVQLIAATHSPLVLASVEPAFDDEQDGLFLLDIEGQQVSLTQQVWAKQGDVANWLVSDTFGLNQARSLESEHAIQVANAWMRGDLEALPENLNTAATIDAELRRVLAGHDAFWPRWVVWVEHQGKS